MRFRKKPVEVEACRLDDPTHPEWFTRAVADGRIDLIIQGPELPMYAEIHTAEGRMLASPGDWIIQGVEGELYPCKPSIFDKTYEFAADGVIDTWAGNWIARIENPDGNAIEDCTGDLSGLRTMVNLLVDQAEQELVNA